MATLSSWICPRCTLENQPSTQVCKACSYSPVSSLPPVQREQSGRVEWKRRPRQSSSSLWGRITGEWEIYWSCPTCKRQNESTVCQCPFCGYIATNVATSGQQPAVTEGTSSISSTWNKFVKKLTGTEETHNTDKSDSVKTTGWSCTNCEFTNHPDLAYCEQCGHGLALVKDDIMIQDDKALPATDKQKDVSVKESDPSRKIVPSPVPIPSKNVPVPNPIYAETSFNEWECPYCTADNGAQNLNCQVCEIGMRPWSGNEDIEHLKDLSATALPKTHADSQPNSRATSSDVPLLRQQSSSSHLLTVQEIRAIEEDIAMDTYKNIVKEYKKVSTHVL